MIPGGKSFTELNARRIDLESGLPSDRVLFSESGGRFVITVAGKDSSAFEAAMAGQSCSRIGAVTAGDRLVIRHGGQTVTDASLTDMKHAFKETLNHV